MESDVGLPSGPVRRDPLKVAVFTPWYPSEDAPWRGTFVRSQLDALCDLDVDVRIFTLAHRFPFLMLAEVDRDGRRVTPERLVAGSAHLAAAIRRSRLWHDEPEVILAQGHWVPTALRSVSLPLVGILHAEGAMTLSGAWRDPVRRGIVARSLRRLDRIVAVGEPVLSDLPPDLRDRATVIPNGVDRGVFARRAVSAASRLAAPDFPRFVTVGHVDPNKNQEVLLRAFPRVRRIWPNANWVIVGDGPRRERLEALRDQLGLHDSVRFVRRLPPSEVAAVLATSDLFVLPSRREAFGCVYLEAMAVGVPTIVPRSSGVAFLVRDERHLHDPMDADEIIAKARAVLTDPESYERAVAHGTAIVEAHSWPRTAERLREVLASAAGRGHAVPSHREGMVL